MNASLKYQGWVRTVKFIRFLKIKFFACPGRSSGSSWINNGSRFRLRNKICWRKVIESGLNWPVYGWSTSTDGVNFQSWIKPILFSVNVSSKIFRFNNSLKDTPTIRILAKMWNEVIIGSFYNAWYHYLLYLVTMKSFQKIQKT